MNEIINLLISKAKTDEVIELNNIDYLYHGIFIPYFEDSSPITSIIENGILTLKDQYKNGIISFDKLQAEKLPRKGLLRFLKLKANNQLNKSEYRDDVVFFSPNRNLFNREFDISFVVRREAKHKYLEDTPNGYFINLNNTHTEDEVIKSTGNHDYTEFVTIGSVLPSEFVAIKINLDRLLDKKSVESRGVSFEEIPNRIINVVNDIYDALEENYLNIPIINSNDGKILNKEVFRELRKMFGYDRIMNSNKAR